MWEEGERRWEEGERVGGGRRKGEGVIKKERERGIDRHTHSLKSIVMVRSVRSSYPCIMRCNAVSSKKTPPAVQLAGLAVRSLISNRRRGRAEGGYEGIGNGGQRD